MAKFFMGVRVPNRIYERLPLENINVEGSVKYLREEISNKLGIPKGELELVYCGTILDDNDTIKDVDIAVGSTIHVFKKSAKPDPYVPKKYDEAECKKLADLFATVSDVSLTVVSRYHIIQSVLAEYPEFRKDLGAQALMKDHVLFQSLKYPQNMEQIAKNYPIICDAAKFIVQLIKKETEKNIPVSQHEETCSDATSSSEEESSSSTSQTELARIRRISRDQLTAALLMAGTASLNSLPNIAQRNSTIAEEQNRQQEQQNAPTSSTSSTTSNSSLPPIRISSASFNNALTQALLASSTVNTETETQNMDVSESGQQSPTLNENLEARFSNELQQMREMGLSDSNVNLQALILTNGNLEAAINLVFSGMN